MSIPSNEISMNMMQNMNQMMFNYGMIPNNMNFGSNNLNNFNNINPNMTMNLNNNKFPNFNPNFNFNNNNFNNIRRNRALSRDKLFKCSKCHQTMEYSLVKDHMYSHHLEEEEKKRRYSPLRINIRNRNQPIVVIKAVQGFRPHNNRRHLNNQHYNINNLFNINLNPGVGNYNRFQKRNNFSNNNHNLTFPEIVIDDVKKLEENNQKCMICLDEFHSKEKVTALPCIHFFHPKCIKEWMNKKKECPICKFVLTKDNLDNKMKGM